MDSAVLNIDVKVHIMHVCIYVGVNCWDIGMGHYRETVLFRSIATTHVYRNIIGTDHFVHYRGAVLFRRKNELQLHTYVGWCIEVYFVQR